MLRSFELTEGDLCRRIDDTGVLSPEDKEAIVNKAVSLAEDKIKRIAEHK